jgi:endonuclease YncB( thermonuclease family)
MTIKKKIRLFVFLRRFHWTTRHQRLSLFWLASIIGLVLPWLPSCETTASRTCTVNSIYDGDTMRLTCGGERLKVRLYCIDAPEMGQKPWGKQSRDYLRSITPDQVDLVVRSKDRYGRIVGEVYSPASVQKNLNLAIVNSGMSAVYPRYCNDQQYHRTEQQAKLTKLGVWQKPGLQQTPWQFRHR